MTRLPTPDKLPLMRHFALLLAFASIACGDSSVLVANLRPTAFAGFDSTVATGSTVDLDASGSYDPDGNGLSFTWRIVRGGDGATLTQTSGAQTQVIGHGDNTGAVVVELLAHDGAEASAPDWVAINFVPAAELDRPVAEAGDNRHLTSGGPLVLDGGASTGNPSEYRWLHLSAGDGEIQNIDPAATALVNDLGDGLHVFGLLVRSGELWSVMDCVSVLVAPRPPATSFPAITVFSQQPGSVTLEASGDDITWSLVSGPDGASDQLSADDGNPSRLTFPAETAGLHLFAATDDAGLADWYAVELETAP